MQEKSKIQKVMIVSLLITVGLIINEGINMNENNIDNIDKWTDEILDYTKKSSLYEEYDGDRYEKLIYMASNTKEIKVVQGLMHCLKYELPGMDQTIENTLATIEPLIYYRALFELTPELVSDKNNRDVFIRLLSQAHGDKYTEDEWKAFYDIAKKHLSKKDVENVLLAFKEGDYDNEDDDYPYPQFYQLFKKLLKEKSE